MKKDGAIYIKAPKALISHAGNYADKKRVKGGLSGLIRDLLIEATKFKIK